MAKKDKEMGVDISGLTKEEATSFGNDMKSFLDEKLPNVEYTISKNRTNISKTKALPKSNGDKNGSK